jgi:hypothetical protein
MTPAQYKKLSTLAKRYFNSLDLETVKAEFTKDSLLNRNKKLEKGTGIPNFGLELTPSKFAQDIVNMCGNEGICLFTCLVFSGQDNMMKSKSMILSNTLKKRIRRTFLLIMDPDFALAKLTEEIQALSDTYQMVALRMNVFSDLDWVKALDPTKWDNVIWYDYTKKVSNLESSTKKSFTYSASEKDQDKDLIALLNRGYNVAMVFHTNKLPSSWNGFKVIDGDEHDRRYEDPKGVVVGLKQKTTMGGKTKTKFTRDVA